MTNEMESLLATCFSQSAELEGYGSNELIGIAENLCSETEKLSEIYVSVHEGTSLEDSPLGIQQMAEEYRFPDSELLFGKREFLCFLSIIIDSFEEILPLGTVVDLKKEHLRNKLPVDKIENVRIIITHRFLHNPKERFYFPYAGVVYPLGSMGEERTLHFTSPFIETVVHKGYSDEQETAFVLMMKHELLCNRRLRSYSFATKEDVKK